MREIAVTVDGVTVALRAPGAVDLPVGGVVSDRGVERAVARGVTVDVPRQLPVHVEPAPVAERRGVTIGETEALITDRDTGRYPHPGPFRDELTRALRFACEQWGADTPWESIDDAAWTKLLRRRCEALVAKNARAVRATEITVARLITAAAWLRDNRRISRDAAIPPRLWKKEVVRHWKALVGSDRDPQPNRPRYTLEEFQRILAASDFDPRLYLLLHVAVGQRPGQVVRARRSDIRLPVIDWSSVTDDTDFGTFEVHGAGKKGGNIIDLTRGQREAIDAALTGAGYLARIEARYQAKDVTDYKVFPCGYIVGRVGFVRGRGTALSLSEKIDFAKHCSGSWLRKNWREAEARAGVEHIHGRSTYGQRRLTVDVAVAGEVSPAGIQAVGGWAAPDMPLAVYADAKNAAGRREARPVRARMLGEVGA